ncbi:hypothetical protein ACEPPN_005674 [Leptodophora sp. 'Broadleaf-Isolate-01']
MASFAIPPSRSSPQGPQHRQKSASPWRITRSSPCLPVLPARNPLHPVPVSPTLGNKPAPNPLYQSSSSDLPERIVRLELTFSLRQNGRPRGPTEEELPELRQHFPTLQSVSFQHPYLVLVVAALPTQPWPVLVADVPLWLTSDPNDVPIGIGQMSRASLRFTIEGELIEYETPSEKTMLEIFELVNEKGAAVDRIQWDGLTLLALSRSEPSPGWKNILPSRINSFLISYSWNEPSMQEHARRMKLPAAGIVDDTRYDSRSLRPGILLGGLTNNMTQTLSTTSGICVESPRSNNKYITVAAHGFSAGIGDLVYHPAPMLSSLTGGPDDRYEIATIDKKFGDTDICLAKLKPGVGYLRETFCDPSQTNVQPFRNLKDPKDVRHGDAVFMNTPVNGLCEGVHITAQFDLKFEATDDEPHKQAKYCEIALFSYFGNGSDVFFDGSCGGVMWDDKFDVLGQFRLQMKGGRKLAIAPSFKILIDQGYRIATVDASTVAQELTAAP